MPKQKETENPKEETKIPKEISLPQTSASSDLGITQEYSKDNRAALWDSTAKKNAFRDTAFGDRKTIVDENGNVLHKSHEAAKKKYHQKNAHGEKSSTAWANHAAEVDHVVSLEELHRHTKSNPFLSDADLREIANSDANYQILSKSENASKGAACSGDLKTHSILHGKLAARTCKNMYSEFKLGAVQGLMGVAPIIIADSLYRLVVEDESLEDTLKAEGKAAASIAISAGTEVLLTDIATSVFNNSGNALLKSITQMNAVGQCLVLGAAIGSSALRFLEGEIDADQFAQETIMNGIAVGITSVISVTVPVPFLAPIISCIAIKALNIVYQTKLQIEQESLKDKMIKKMEREAIYEIEKQRHAFHKLVQENLDQWDTLVESAFEEIVSSSLEKTYNINGIINGLDKILSLCGETARFHSVSEWESQLDTPLTLSF